MRQQASPSATSISDEVGLANIALSLAKVIAESTTFKATVELVGGEPLVRTKETNQFGENRQLKVHASFDIGKGQYANCLRTALNRGGVDFSLPNDGPIKDASVQWTLYDDAGGILNNPVILHPKTQAGIGANGDSAQSKTDGNGDAYMDVQGNKQPHKLAPDSQPYLRNFRVLAALQIKDNSLYSDLKDAIGNAIGGGLGAVTQVLTGLVERTHSLSVQKVVQVKDWTKDFKIDADALFCSPGCDCFPHVTALKCGGLEGSWTLTSDGEQHTVVLDENGRGSAGHGASGYQIEYRPGPPATLYLHNPLFEQAFPVIPGNFTECGDE